MKGTTCITLALLAAIAAAPLQAAPAPGRADLFSFEQGARILKAPADADMTEMSASPFNLIDGSAATDWTGQAGQVSFLFELAETTELHSIAFDTAGLNRDPKGIKAFTIEVSETSPSKGFSEVMSGTLKIARNGQSFAFKPEARPTARWVRLTILSNYGDEYQGFTGFHGYGRQLTQTAELPDLTGKYEGASGWGAINLTDGDTVSGCYEYQAGTFSGQVQGRVLMLDMTERSNDNNRLRGMFQLSPDGRTLYGLVRQTGAAHTDAFAYYYSAERSGGKPARC